MKINQNATPVLIVYHEIFESHLGWKLEFLSLQNFCDVEIEEVTIEDSLDTSGHDSNDVIEAFSIVSVHPVEDVETTIGAESKQVVAGNTLSFSGLGYHEELGQDGHTLQVNGEGPEDLHDAKLMVQCQGKEDCWTKQKFYTESIMVSIISSLKSENEEFPSKPSSKK